MSLFGFLGQNSHWTQFSSILLRALFHYLLACSIAENFEAFLIADSSCYLFYVISYSQCSETLYDLLFFTSVLKFHRDMHGCGPPGF